MISHTSPSLIITWKVISLHSHFRVEEIRPGRKDYYPMTHNREEIEFLSPEFCFRAPGFATTVCHISYWSVGLACLGQVHSSRTEQERQKISWRHSGGGAGGGGKVASKRSSLPYSNVTSKLDVIENQLTLLDYEHCALQIQPASQYAPHWSALTGVPWQVTIANHLENSTCDLEICQGFQ